MFVALSVQLPDDRIDICAAEARVSQVLQKAGFVPGSVTSHREPERQQEVVGGPEAFSDSVDLMDQVLQTDDAVFT